MESAESSWSSETNWTVAGGSLENSITFESSLSSIEHDEHQETTVASTAPKSPLILSPPVPDSGPCEIKLGFTQKHEVRQVYVRSTSRVYEIYYESGVQSGNEYLCTVRCGVAARDEEVLTTDIEEVTTNVNGPNKALAEEDVKNGSNLTTNEDDWVEVKAPGTPVVENKNFSLPAKSNINTGRSKQEFYEATAEITDASPCISLTLRLLSLQSKGCVHIDEVYVFADPVDSDDSENQEGQVENSAGSSLMAMLVPTLLQFSKTTKHSSDTREKQKFPEFWSRATDSTNFATKIQQEGKSSIITDHQEVKGSSVGLAQLQNPPQVPVSENKPDFPPYDRLERVMDQLVSRVGRVEDLFLRFEENMLKPISSIEARLQRVEQQLELLTKKSQSSGLPSCSRICAPEFSCNESDSNSFYNSGSDCTNCGSFQLDKKDFHSDGISISPDDTSDSVNATQLLPGLVVTAPEFSNGDDEEENFTSESVANSSNDKPRQALSIDDALAFALAGFLSSTSTQSPKYTQTLAIKAPEFSNEEDGNDDKQASPRVQREIAADHSVSFCGIDETVCIEDSTSFDTCLESEGNVTRSLDHDHSEKTPEGADKGCQHCEGGEGDCQGTGNTRVALVEHDEARSDFFQITEEDENGEVNNGISNVQIPDNSTHLHSNETEDGSESSDTIQEGAVLSTEFTAAGAEITKGGSDILQKVLEYSCASSVVDFETPVLDVKFVSQENSKTTSPLEALLADMRSTVEAPCVKESNDDSPIGDQCNLILVEDGEPSDPAISMDMNYNNLMDVPSIIEGENLQDYHPTCCSHEIFAPSLI